MLILVGFVEGGDAESLVRDAIAVEALVVMEKMVLDKIAIASSSLVWFWQLHYTFEIIVIF